MAAAPWRGVRAASESLSGCIAAALVGLAAVAITAELCGCAEQPAAPADPNANMLRDFLDGKFDGDGHPINSRVTQAAALCGKTGSGDVRLGSGDVCTSTALAGAEQQGDLVVSAHVGIHAHPSSGNIVRVDVVGTDGKVIATETLTVARLRNATAVDWPVSWSSDGSAVTLTITPAAGASVDLSYVEVFPARFGLVAAPGSGPVADTDTLELELSLDHKVDRLSVDGTDITAQYNTLLSSGVATRTVTDFRAVVDVGVAALLPMRGDVSDVMIHSGDDAARLQLRHTPPPCAFEGDPDGVKVIVTGFQPFPADEAHDNVAGVAVTALDPTQLHGAQVMKLVMPVEYDRAPAEVADAISRCQPSIVISFGQGGDSIALEETAYNLQDTGEVTGGVPDNRGVVRVATPIDATAPATRATLLPLDAIEQALVAAGEAPEHSTDPGRYVCNNVMWADIGAMTGHGRAGFIHLPYTTDFDDATRARFGKVVQLAIQATVDQK